MEYILAGRDNDAASLWKQYLQNAEVIVFRRLLQESFVRKEPKLIEKLIEYLKSNKSISQGSIVNAYSRLIGHYVYENDFEQAEKVLEEATNSGIQSEHLNKNSLLKLKAAAEAAGREFTYKIALQ